MLIQLNFFNNEDAYVDIHTLPDNYVTKNAWNYGFSKFQEMNNQVDTPRPKYHDFKVKMSNLQTEANTMDPDMFGINGQFTSHGPNDWDMSKYTTLKSDGGDADQFEVHMLGPHVGNEGNWQSVGLIKSYAMMRAYPDTTGEPVLRTNHQLEPLGNLFDASGDHAMEELSLTLDTANDETPYPTFYLGESDNSMQHVGRLATTTSVGRISKISGFCAPLGLICVDPQSTASTYRITINLAAGTYHGVYAERA